jgi:hypothetical protein
MSSRSASEDDILAICDKALSIAPSSFPPTLRPVKELAGAPEWHAFEHAAWPLGESIRQAFSGDRRLRRKANLLARVAEVATCRNLRRGRQSFIMALGFVDAVGHASALSAFLADTDVNGHIVDTLLKMKAGGYVQVVCPLLQSDKAWIRRLAKKYVDRYVRAG